MQAKTQTWFSFFFFLGSVLVSIVVVQGGWSDIWRTRNELSAKLDDNNVTVTSQYVSQELLWIRSLIEVVQEGWSDIWRTRSEPSAKLDVPWVSQNFDASVVKFLNKQSIPKHQHASYTYLMMSAYFSRADVALPGFAKYFRKASDRELESAKFWMNYINKRGGHVKLREIETSSTNRWTDGIDALQFALQMERDLNQQALDLREVADNSQDPHLSHTVEDQFLEPKVNLIKELGDHLAVLEKMKGEDYGLGEYVFDENL